MKLRHCLFPLFISLLISGFPALCGQTNADIMDKLEQLQEMVDRGLITQEDYDRSKEDLLESFLQGDKSADNTSNNTESGKSGNNSSASSFTPAPLKSLKLYGAGATFPYPLYYNWFKIYKKIEGVRVEYDAIGSGSGIDRLISRDVDFGATDAFMSEKELLTVPDTVLHMPTALGAVAVTYNLPGNPKLRMNGEILAGIFLGEIKNWNDPMIAELNPELFLPDKKITPVHRADSSGTTFIFTDYLSKVSPIFDNKIGRTKKPNWPAGISAKKNHGISQVVTKVEGSIAYIELTYAIKNHLPVASIRNNSGNYIPPSLAAVSAAAKIDLPPDTRVSITNTDAPEGYPICSFTWIICYKEQSYNNRSLERAQELAKLLRWMIQKGQYYNEKMLYASLPEEAILKAEAIIHSLTYNGHPLTSL